MARFLITPEWTGAKVPGGPGRVVLRLMEKDRVSGKVRRVRLRTEVSGYGETVLRDRREEIVGLIRVVYSIIAGRVEAGGEFGVEDVVEDFRRALSGDEGIAHMTGMAGEEAALRADLVSLGGGFKGDFRYVYPMDEGVSDSLTDYVGGLVQSARNEGRDSRVRTFSSVRRSLSRFLDGKDVRLVDVDREFVEDYSKWLAGEGVAASTQSFFLRSLRAVLNQAKEDGAFNNGDGLFAGLNTRVIFKGERDEDTPVSGQLSREAMWRIANMDLSEDEGLMVVRDMFMFAFYCRGMELTDVMNVTRECVHEGMLTYRRRSNGRVKSVILDENALSIIRRYWSDDDDHLFPLLRMHRGLRQYSLNGVVRRSLRAIGEMAGEPELSFGMNISTWQGLVAQIDPAVMLRGSA